MIKYGAIIIITLLSTEATTAQSREEASLTFENSDLAIHCERMITQLVLDEGKGFTLKGVRARALLFGAMHNALNSIRPMYHSYKWDYHVPEAHPLVAASHAAFVVCKDQFPERKSFIMQSLAPWLDHVAPTESMRLAKELGTEAAEHVLHLRTDDGYNQKGSYQWLPAEPGVYTDFYEHSQTPKGFILGAGWGDATPFLLRTPDQFRSLPPPSIDSEEYAEAFNEVKKYGRDQSEARTEDQSHLAMWWKELIENSHNRLANELIQKEALNLWQATRLFALLNMATFDAYVCVFNNKYYYNHWRPYTAILSAANDGNSETVADSTWNNLHHHTYAFPSYPSAHGTASAAAMTVLAHALGTGDKYVFTMTTPEVESAGPLSEKIRMNPVSRSFDSFSEAALEAALSRVYLGIHFRYDSEHGFELGNRIGEYAVTHFLIPRYPAKAKK